MGKDIQHYPGTCEVTMAALAKTSFTPGGNALDRVWETSA